MRIEHKTTEIMAKKIYMTRNWRGAQREKHGKGLGDASGKFKARYV